jgi:ribosomal protein L29
MAKRSTIGENPLDAVNRENPLDTVVPDLTLMTRVGRGQGGPELPAAAREQLEKLETGLTGVRNDMAGLRTAAGEAAALTGAVGELRQELARLKEELTVLKGQTATVMDLKAEVNRLQGELTQLRAVAAGPGDLPWWMRGKKK